MTNNLRPDGPQVLLQYLNILKRRARLIAIAVLIAMVIGALAAFLMPGKYAGTTTVIDQPIIGEVAPGGGRARTVNLETEVIFARSGEIITATAEALGVSQGAVRKATSVEAAPFGDAMTFTYSDTDAKRAAAGADAYATAYLAAREAKGLATIETQRSELSKLITDLQTKLTDLTGQIASTAEGDVALAVLRQNRDIVTSQLDEASLKLARVDRVVNPGAITRTSPIPTSQNGLSLPTALAGGLLAGLIIGVFVAFTVDRLDAKFVALDDPERLGLRELGTIPEQALGGVERLAHDVDSQHTLLRVLLHLEQVLPQRESISVLITAPDHHSVPLLSGLLQGLAHVAKNNGESAAVMQVSWAAVFGDRLSSRRTEGRWEQVRTVLDQMATRHRYVFIDPPPLDRSADTLAVAAQVDAVVLVVTDRTPVEAAVKAQAELRAIGKEVAGYLRVRRPRRHGWRRAQPISTTPTAMPVRTEDDDAASPEDASRTILDRLESEYFGNGIAPNNPPATINLLQSRGGHPADRRTADNGRIVSETP